MKRYWSNWPSRFVSIYFSIASFPQASQNFTNRMKVLTMTLKIQVNHPCLLTRMIRTITNVTDASNSQCFQAKRCYQTTDTKSCVLQILALKRKSRSSYTIICLTVIYEYIS